jgi:hypothetical protein
MGKVRVAAMMEERIIEAKIEQTFRSKPWVGGISVEEAIANAIRYRRNLSEEDRRLYDEQIRLGRHPIKALETVEIVSGRDQPHGSESEETVLSTRK